jgi:hypothetical protein
MCAGATGCQANVVPVSGRVTLNGKPLAGAVVTFQPKTGRDLAQPATTGSVGRTDAQGRFTLRLVAPDRPGAAPGEHAITISTAASAPQASSATEEHLPKSWRDGSQRFHVPAGGTREANFDIKSG